MANGKPPDHIDNRDVARALSLTDRLQSAIARARTQGLGIALMALIILFAVRAPGFATIDNFGDALRDLSILGILAVGETFVIIGGGIDLSVGSVLLLAGIVSDDLIRLGEVHTAIAIPIALGVGCLAGAINGFLITRLRISAFIVTLASLYMFRGAGLSLYRTDVQNLQAAIISDDNFLILGQDDIFGIPVSFVIFVVLLGVGAFVLRRTRFGLHLYALGGSELAARLTRIRVAPIQVSTYVIGGFCSALAGIILASRLQTGAPEAGSGEEFDVIAAVIIGGASLFGGRGTLVGTLLGAAFITVLAKGQTLIGVPANYQSFTRGVVILIAVALDVLSQRSIAAPRRPRWANILNPTPPDALAAAELPHGSLQQGAGQQGAGVPPVLQAAGLHKSFVEIRAVDGVDFAVGLSEVHAIVGENGAGKSTLIKMLAGALSPDAGEILIDGVAVSLNSVAAAQDRGIAVIYQERAVVPELTVAQNIMLGHEPTYRLPGLINRGAQRHKAEQIWALLGSPASVDTVVRELAPSIQQLVDIARALAFEARVVIMDEPTAALTHQETLRLFEIIRDLKRRGTAVIYISHDLEEIFEVADRVTVLRDGKLVRTLPVAEVTRPALIRMMIGRDIDESVRHEISLEKHSVLSVKGLRRGTVIDDVSFTLRSGELLGIAGLVGSGRTEVLRAIFGADPIDGGEMMLHGRAYAPHSPIDAVRAGVGLVPEDRKSEGLIPAFTISENLSLPNYDLVSTAGTWLSAARERRLATRMVAQLKIDPPIPRWRTNHLSGGNQQKVVLSKWMAKQPKLLLVDEPTHGVDVGAREEIYRVLDDLVKSGVGVVVVSSYLPEVLRISDRILVMRDGRIALEVDRADATEEVLLDAATGGSV
jgi:ABC-type sugar transport system ATPase subunit/ribose/xylose/arabinose/galactoside ABC-type transport system permease subunit